MLAALAVVFVAHIVAGAGGVSGISTSVYNFVYIVLGCFAAFGGAWGAFKWAKGRGVEDKQFKQVVDIVLPSDKGEGGIQAALGQLSAQLDTLARNSLPNGGNTKSLGDTVERMDKAVRELTSTVDRQIGASEATNAEFRLRLDRIEGKKDE